MESNAPFLIFHGVGALLLLIALYLLVRTRMFVSRSVRTEGLVIDQEESNDEGVSYSPVVRFTTDDGATITFTDSISTNPAMYRIGETVGVFYLPEQPGTARIASTFRLYMATIILALIGGLFVGIGMWGLSGMSGLLE